ncbi:hypothetical protein Trydic_g14948 [Trypoxylus dichotomus]
MLRDTTLGIFNHYTQKQKCHARLLITTTIILTVLNKNEVVQGRGHQSLLDIADKYFGSINSLANRIFTDMNETKATYEDIWGSLTEEERSQIMNETIIKPEICLKYSIKPQTINVNIRKKNEFAAKIVVDDNYSYRDEHSAPFSFRTPSQRNLTLFNNADKSLSKTPTVESKPKEPKIPLLIQFKIEDDISSKHNQETEMLNIPKTGLDLLDNW